MNFPQANRKLCPHPLNTSRDGSLQTVLMSRVSWHFPECLSSSESWTPQEEIKFVIFKLQNLPQVPEVPTSFPLVSAKQASNCGTATWGWSGSSWAGRRKHVFFSLMSQHGPNIHHVSWPHSQSKHSLLGSLQHPHCCTVIPLLHWEKSLQGEHTAKPQNWNSFTRKASGSTLHLIWFTAYLYLSMTLVLPPLRANLRSFTTQSSTKVIGLQG